MFGGNFGGLPRHLGAGKRIVEPEPVKRVVEEVQGTPPKVARGFVLKVRSPSRPPLPLPRPSSWLDERRPVWQECQGIVVSATLSIHNRIELFRRALETYVRQTLSPEKWEIVLVDDMSTQDLREAYDHLLGSINIRHVRMDHTRHPVFRRRNPGWKPGHPEDWFHTPAISTNIGIDMAAGPVVCLCHPEIMHAPRNFEWAATRILSFERSYLFGKVYIATQGTNRWFEQASLWTGLAWPELLARIETHKMTALTDECYWYASFLPKVAARTVRGVDFAYLDGVCGEDDDFRERVSRAGWSAVYAPEIEGIHQDHSDERETHRQRDTSKWNLGMERNRAHYIMRKDQGFSGEVNPGDWAAKECVVGVRGWKVGKREPLLEWGEMS